MKGSRDQLLKVLPPRTHNEGDNVKVIHFGVDGTGDANDDDYFADMKDSYVHRIDHFFKAAGPSRYLRGPSLWGTECPDEAEKAVRFVLSNRPVDGNCAIFLSGHSRGGIAVIEAARRLRAKGITVDCMILFDAVDRCAQILWSHIPSNVKRVIHALRNRATLSRPEFDNCGLVWNPLTTADTWCHFYTTHGGVGGTPWPKQGRNGRDKIWEPIGGGIARPTMVTYDQDRLGSQLVWGWTWPRVLHAYREITNQRFPTPTLPPGESEQLYTIVKGDTLSLLAQRYYGDAMQWPKIFDANREVIRNENLIEPGWTIKIPA